MPRLRLLERLRSHREWHRFRSSRPGDRFHRRYRRIDRAAGRRRWWRRPLLIGLAFICLAIGAVLAVLPGPAFVFFGLALLLLATTSRSLAKALDRAELALRARWRRKGSPSG